MDIRWNEAADTNDNVMFAAILCQKLGGKDVQSEGSEHMNVHYMNDKEID